MHSTTTGSDGRANTGPHHVVDPRLGPHEHSGRFAGLKLFTSSVRSSPGLARLLWTKLLSQYTDGLFQAALGGAILFNPQRAPDALAVATGMAVLLLPYSFVGPFAGALLDHWDRRTVLVWANVLRALLMVLVATTLAVGAGDTTVLICALTVTGASRFVASGLSAGLPHVVHRSLLVAMNAFFTTTGSVVLAIGAGTALALRQLFGPDNAGGAAIIATAVVAALAGAAVAWRFGKRQLGPDHPDQLDETHPDTSAFRAVTVGWAHGARAIWQAPIAAAALCGVASHRIAFGFNTLILLMLTKHSGAVGGGIGGFGFIASLIATGMFIAAIITPLLVKWFGRRPTLLYALVVGAAANLLILGFSTYGIIAAAVLVGMLGQIVKLCCDSAMQSDVDDARIGQAFSLQDAVFNIGFVGAVTLAALVVPYNGHSALLVALGSVAYLTGAGIGVAISRRHTYG